MTTKNNASTASSAPSPTPPVPASAKPTIVADDVKVSAGNGTSPINTPVATDSTTSGSPDADNESDPLMFCIVVGTVKQFKTAAKAEEYLNGPEAPSDYVVIRGRLASTKRKISLRG